MKSIATATRPARAAIDPVCLACHVVEADIRPSMPASGLVALPSGRSGQMTVCVPWTDACGGT
jgi:hypothetical protein